MASVALRLEPVDHKAARFACRAWHYSRSAPSGKTYRLGVFEDGEFIGVVMFSRGATGNIGRPYGLSQAEICELTRIALRDHATPVSRIVAIALKMLHRTSPGLRLVISYAAAEEGHHGGVYQAGNWIYTGAAESRTLIVKGQKFHARTFNSKKGGSSGIAWLRENVDPYADIQYGLVRHKYLMPLDAAMRRQVEPLRRPYPKRDKQAMAGPHPAQRRCDSDRHAPIEEG